MTGSVSLAVDRLTAGYDDVPAVSNVSFRAEGNQIIGLVGPNGAGKTTLLKTIAGLMPAKSGCVAIDGRPTEEWPRNDLARRVGYLSQERTVHWPVTVERLVSLGRLPHRGPWDGLSAADQESIDRALEFTDTLSLSQRAVTALSGGELARVLLARVLAGDPKIILADEPVSGLDPGHALQVLAGLRDLTAEGRLVVIVLHDLFMASRFCDRLILLNHGGVAADGAPSDVLTPHSLRDVYGVDAQAVVHNGETALVPWGQA